MNDTVERNWAGNYTYRATRLHRPTRLAEAQEAVARAARIRVLGSRHSFNDLADSPGELLTMDQLAGEVALDAASGTVTVPGALRYGALAIELERQGFALHNLASLPHISVAGACATGTHGSGDRQPGLAAAVEALELIGADGELTTLRRGEPDFAGAVVGLGALGIVHRMTLRVEPTYRVRQTVYGPLGWETVLANLDVLTASAYSVSLFTSWGAGVDQMWCKERVDHDASPAPADVFGAPAVAEKRHPLPGIDPTHCTEQLGVAGAWHDRLPHFRMAFTPSNGDELQSEYLVAREHAAAVIEALRPLGERMRPHLQVTEIRTVAADDLWLSPAYQRDTLGLHFTWLPHGREVAELLPAIEEALAPFGVRPHWGKLFAMGHDRLTEVFPRLGDFADLVTRRDPTGTFRNAFLERTVFG